MPRYLSMDHLQVLVNRLEEWDTKMDNIIRVVENGSEELVRGVV